MNKQWNHIAYIINIIILGYIRLKKMKSERKNKPQLIEKPGLNECSHEKSINDSIRVICYIFLSMNDIATVIILIIIFMVSFIYYIHYYVYYIHY